MSAVDRTLNYHLASHRIASRRVHSRPRCGAVLLSRAIVMCTARLRGHVTSASTTSSAAHRPRCPAPGLDTRRHCWPSTVASWRSLSSRPAVESSAFCLCTPYERTTACSPLRLSRDCDKTCQSPSDCIISLYFYLLASISYVIRVP